MHRNYNPLTIICADLLNSFACIRHWLLFTGSSGGGCRPISLSAARILIILGRLNANSVTVARPVDVKPIIKSVSVD